MFPSPSSSLEFTAFFCLFVGAIGTSPRPARASRARMLGWLAEKRTHVGPELIAVGTPDDLGIDTERDGRIDVAYLGLHVRDIEAGREHESDVGATERVRGDVGEDRRLVSL